MKRHGIREIAVPAKAHLLLERCRAPQAHDSIQADPGKELTIGAERQGDGQTQLFDGYYLVPRGRIPDGDVAEEVRDRRDPLPVGAEDSTTDVVPRTSNAEASLPGGSVPDRCLA